VRVADYNGCSLSAVTRSQVNGHHVLSSADEAVYWATPAANKGSPTVHYWHWPNAAEAGKPLQQPWKLCHGSCSSPIILLLGVVLLAGWLHYTEVGLWQVRFFNCP